MKLDNITAKTGTWEDALRELEDTGGMLFPGKDSESPTTVVRGKKTTTYWKEGSYKRGELIKLAQEFGFSRQDALKLTGGRLARWYINEVLELPYKDTYFGEKYLKLAREAWHWHYLSVTPGSYLFCVEVDLKSAYHSALLTGESLLLSDNGEWLDDNGALSNIKIQTNMFPKWFRLTLLGTMACHRLGFLHRDKSKDKFEVKYSEQSKISYGAAFNACHRAILRNWRIMKELHEIGGEAIVRCHTDSLLIDMARITGAQEQQIFDKLDEYGLETTVKKAGRTSLKDVNTGFVGRHLIGAKPDVLEFAREIKSLPERTNPYLEETGEIATRATEIKEGIFSDKKKEILEIDPLKICERLGQIFARPPSFFEANYLKEITAKLPPKKPSRAREKWAREELIAVDMAAKIIEEGGLKKPENLQMQLFG